MDYEKKYNEALERAKEIKEKIMYSHLSTESCKAVSEYIDTIIPELTESEDLEEDALLLERAWLTLDGFGHEELAGRLRQFAERKGLIWK